MKRCVPLEAEAEAVCNENSVPPLIFQLPPKQGREILEKAQDTPVCKYPDNISVNKINTGKWGTIPVYFVMLNALDKTNACQIAMDASTQWINRKNECIEL